MRRCALPVPAAMAIVVAIFGCQSLRRTYVPLEGAAIGGDSFGSGGGAQNGANAGPIVTFTEPPSRVKGGSAWAFDYTVTSPRKIAAVQLQYARDGDALTEPRPADRPRAAAVASGRHRRDRDGGRHCELHALGHRRRRPDGVARATARRPAVVK